VGWRALYRAAEGRELLCNLDASGSSWPRVGAVKTLIAGIANVPLVLAPVAVAAVGATRE